MLQYNSEELQKEWKEACSALDAWVKKWDVEEEVYHYALAQLFPEDIWKGMRRSEEYYRKTPREMDAEGKPKKRPAMGPLWSE
jgi:hypothetical protein